MTRNDPTILEGARLYSVLERRLEGCAYVCNDYSVVDVAIDSWTRPWRRALYGRTACDAAPTDEMT